MKRNPIRTVCALAASLLAVLLLVQGAGSASAATAARPIWLPDPSGPYPTGTTLLHLVDRGRTDTLDPRHGVRELMTQVWYPAWPIPGYRRAPYMPDREARVMETADALAPGSVQGARTHSALDAPAVPGRRPVVLFYPGFCGSRTDTTAFAEQLASDGMVVVATASTHESAAVQFPGGRLVTDASGVCASDLYGAGGLKLQRVRVADTRFVLDELARLDRGVNPDVDGHRLPFGLAGSLDLNRVGMYGHSLGGSTTAEAMHEDRRIRAGVNLDGLVVGPVQKAGLDRPFLIFGSDYHSMASDPSWKTFLPRLRGWYERLRLAGAGHYRFDDLGGSARQWDMRSKMDGRTWYLNFGSIGDHRALLIVRAYLGAFFEHFLRAVPAPLLECPSPRYPEVSFRTP